MKRVIVIFKNESNASLIDKVGGKLINNLNNIKRLLIAEIPEDKIEELERFEEVLKVEIEQQLKIEPQADPIEPHLIMEGLSYIQLPSMTYTSIEMDCQLDKSVSTASRYYFDNRAGGGTAYFYTNSSNSEWQVGLDVYLDGVKSNSETDFLNYVVSNQRYSLKIQMESTYTGNSLLFSRNGIGFHGYGKIYSITIKNVDTIVAQYDMGTGTLQDQSGNGNHATLTGGAWEGIVVAEATLPQYEKKDADLNWSLTALRAKDYWERGVTGKGVKVAVFDVSFPKHNYINYNEATSVLVDKDVYLGAYGNLVHGLECASAIRSDVVNTNSGIHSGIGMDSEIYVVKMHDNYGGVATSDVVSSINWAIEKGVDIISFSFIVFGAHDSAKIAIDDFTNNHGGVFFMSSGNQTSLVGSDSLNGYPTIYLVGGIGKNYKRYVEGSSGSNYGDNVEFVSTYESVQYKTNSKSATTPTISDEIGVGKGTSYSCPQAVGIFCLYKEVYPNKTNSEIVQLMGQSATKLDGRTDWDMYYGHGLLQPSDDILKMPRKISENGLRFYGLNDYIDCGNNASLNLTNNLTLIAEFTQDFGGNGFLFSKNDHEADGEPFYGVHLGHKFKVGNKVSINYAHGSNVFAESEYPLGLADGRRHRLTVVYSYPNIRVYVDGVLITDALTMDGSMLESVASKLSIGSSNISGEGSFAGVLHEAKVYNRSLSTVEVQNNEGNTTGLVLHYRFDGNESTTANDLSGNGNHGTIIGAIPSVRRANAVRTKTKTPVFISPAQFIYYG